MLKFIYKNVNPKGKETADCVTRALVLATELPYEEIVKLQMAHSLETGESFANKVVYEKILSDYGYVKKKQPKRNDGTMYCIEEMDKLLTKEQLMGGVFVTVNSHVSYIKGNNYYDIWDCGDCCVRNYYIKKDKDIKNENGGNELKKQIKTVKSQNNKSKKIEFVANVKNVYNKLQNNFGSPFSNGNKECIQNIIIDLLKKSAESGNAEAQYNLGAHYYNGDGVEKSYEKAVCWFINSANQGNPDAEKMMAVCYYNGFGVKQSYENAVYWIKKSAEQGNCEAAKMLASCYYNGIGVKKSYDKATYWFNKTTKLSYKP